MTELLTSISRSDTIPIVKQITVTKNKGYLTLDVSSFTPRMFYELPAIRFEVYTETNGTRVKYNTVDNVIRTYQPELFPDNEKIVVCIRNIPNECYLYITPIFDNDSVPARNMLIENGIETGDLWDITPTATFPITIGFDGQTEPGYPTTTITGVPPISFQSDGTPLTAWSISGNMTSTQECGDRTANLCPMIFSHSGVGDDVGTIVTMSTRLWSSKISVLPSQSYYAMINGEASNHEELLFNRIIQYDANGEFISRISVVNQTEAEITTSTNCHFVVLDIRTRTLTVDITMDDITAVMLSAGSQASYEPYGYKISVTVGGATHNIYLDEPIRKALDGSDAVDVLRSDGTLTRGVDSEGNALVTPTTETVTVPTLTPTKGSNTLSIGTTLQPSEVSITGGIK